MGNDPNLKAKINNNNISIIKDNSINNKETKLDIKIVIETLIKIFCFQEKIKQIFSNKNSTYNGVLGIIINKNLIEKYKEFFCFKDLQIFFESNPTVLDCIKDNNIIDLNKLNNMDISAIINQLDKDLFNKIENKINNNLLNEMQKEVTWNYKYIELDDSKKKKFLNDFEIINYEIFSLLIEQKISAVNCCFADYFINGKNILIIIKDFGDDVFFEIGEYNNDKGINIKYNLDVKKIGDSTAFKQVLVSNGLDDIFKKINSNNYINLIEFNEFQINCYKIDNSKIQNMMGKKLIKINNKEGYANFEIKDKKDNFIDDKNIIKNDNKKEDIKILKINPKIGNKAIYFLLII